MSPRCRVVVALAALLGGLLAVQGPAAAGHVTVHDACAGPSPGGGSATVAVTTDLEPGEAVNGYLFGDAGEIFSTSMVDGRGVAELVFDLPEDASPWYEYLVYDPASPDHEIVSGGVNVDEAPTCSGAQLDPAPGTGEDAPDTAPEEPADDPAPDPEPDPAPEADPASEADEPPPRPVLEEAITRAEPDPAEPTSGDDEPDPSEPETAEEDLPGPLDLPPTTTDEPADPLREASSGPIALVLPDEIRAATQPWWPAATLLFIGLLLAAAAVRTARRPATPVGTPGPGTAVPSPGPSTVVPLVTDPDDPCAEIARAYAEARAAAGAARADADRTRGEADDALDEARRLGDAATDADHDAQDARAAREAAEDRAAPPPPPDEEGTWVEDPETGRRTTLRDLRLRREAEAEAWDTYRDDPSPGTAEELQDAWQDLDAPEAAEARRAADDAARAETERAIDDAREAERSADERAASAADEARAAADRAADLVDAAEDAEAAATDAEARAEELRVRLERCRAAAAVGSGPSAGGVPGAPDSAPATGTPPRPRPDRTRTRQTQLLERRVPLYTDFAIKAELAGDRAREVAGDLEQIVGTFDLLSDLRSRWNRLRRRGRKAQKDMDTIREKGLGTYVRAEAEARMRSAVEDAVKDAAIDAADATIGPGIRESIEVWKDLPATPWGFAFRVLRETANLGAVVAGFAARILDRNHPYRVEYRLEVTPVILQCQEIVEDGRVIRHLTITRDLGEPTWTPWWSISGRTFGFRFAGRRERVRLTRGGRFREDLAGGAFLPRLNPVDELLDDLQRSLQDTMNAQLDDVEEAVREFLREHSGR